MRSALAEALRGNATLTSMSLNYNQIGDRGCAARWLIALRENATVTTIRLENNRIGDGGARALADALRENETVTGIGPLPQRDRRRGCARPGRCAAGERDGDDYMDL